MTLAVGDWRDALVGDAYRDADSAFHTCAMHMVHLKITARCAWGDAYRDADGASHTCAMRMVHLKITARCAREGRVPRCGRRLPHLLLRDALGRDAYRNADGASHTCAMRMVHLKITARCAWGDAYRDADGASHTYHRAMRFGGTRTAMRTVPPTLVRCAWCTSRRLRDALWGDAYRDADDALHTCAMHMVHLRITARCAWGDAYCDADGAFHTCAMRTVHLKLTAQCVWEDAYRRRRLPNLCNVHGVPQDHRAIIRKTSLC
ncbi:hypothetical protein K438DRAFT_1782574 [Mycena galopus ATCC 62051]|nr:hypothetical protein K438DRAFT_1782574 [Mycena galopus ATCC 62051]